MCQKDNKATILEMIAFGKGRNCYLFIPLEPNEKKNFKETLR